MLLLINFSNYSYHCFIMKTLKNRTLWILLFCFILVPCVGNSLTQQNIYIENSKIKLGFNSLTGAFVVFRDLVNDWDFLDENTIFGLPWEIELFQPSGMVNIDRTASSEFYYSKPNPFTIILTWKNFSGYNKDFKITAVVTLIEDEPLSSWKLSLEGIKGKQISRVVFPKIEAVKDLGNENLAVPNWMGELIKNPRASLSKISRKKKKYVWDYPGHLSLQCLALYNSEKCGFYASCNDTLAYRKDFSISLDTLNKLVYQINNYPAFDSTLNTFTIPYEALIGTFKGDWLTAAERYREWGSKQKWCAESRLKKKEIPLWLENNALWVWNRGKSPNVLTPATELKQRLGLPVSVLWHWWHGCSYDDGFPEYFPPREGKEAFVSALTSAQDKGVSAMVYMNLLKWGNSTESWKNENASFYSVKNMNGEMRSHVYNIFTRKSLTYMCMATQFWRDKYSSLCDSAVNTYQTNGVYMDQTCLSSMCYDSNHGHALGGGNYWVNNFGELMRQIRSKISQEKQSAFAGEGCGEVWLPYVDAFLTLQVSRERYAGVGDWETIPFFQAVYHQYGITFGNYSSLLTPPYDELWPKEFTPKEPQKLLDSCFNKQFLMEQARSFVWGMQPTIANYQSFLASERKVEIDYLLKVAKVRYLGLKYLLYGKFVRPPYILSPEEEFNISKLSIYAGRTGKSITTFQKKYPLVYSAAWQADDKQIGIALASINNSPFDVNFKFKAEDYGLPTSGKIFIIDADGKRFLTAYAGENIYVNFTLQPKGVCIVEIVPDI